MVWSRLSLSGVTSHRRIPSLKSVLVVLWLCAASASAATLTVRWSGEGGARSEKLSLVPVDAALPETLPRAEAIARWTRAIEGSQQSWEGLSAGTYRIILRSAEAGSAAPPVDLGEVVLSDGEERTITIALPPRDPSGGERQTIRLLTAPQDEALAVSLWRGDDRMLLSPVRERARGGLVLRMDAPCVAGSILLVQSANAVGSTTLDGDCSEIIELAMVPRAVLTMRLTVPADMQLPRSAVLHLTRCAQIPFTTAATTVQVSVPSGCGDMTVRANGFTPVTLSLRDLKAGQTADAGTIALRQGAAAAVRIRSAADGGLLRGVRVMAIRAHDLAAVHKAEELDARSFATAVSNAGGWARLDGLPDERVVFLFQGPGRKRPQISEPYELKRGTETLLDDLLLEPPSNVSITVLASAELRKSLQIDTVELLPGGNNRWPERMPISAALTEERAVVEDVPSGTWDIYAAGRLKNGFALRAARTTIEVAGGTQQHVALTITDTLYRGRVTRDGTPVSGTINLRPAVRKGGRQAVARVGADGMFQVLLDGQGEYSVRVQEPDGGGASLSRYVSFADPDDEVAIELPSGRIAGRVIDSTGAPVSGAVVSASQQLSEHAGAAYARNTPDGQFVLNNIESGTWELVAETKNGRGDPVAVSVDRDDLEDVTLIVEPVRTVHIRLTDITGALVREAFVSVETPQTGSLNWKSDIRSTGSDGIAEFRVSAARQSTPHNLIVATLDLRIACALRSMDADQSVILPPAFGELQLSGREWERSAAEKRFLLSQTGCAVPFLATRREGDAIVFPKLAAGTWSYVEIRTPQELALLLTGGAPALRVIQTFTVEPGKITRVALPPAPPVVLRRFPSNGARLESRGHVQTVPSPHRSHVPSHRCRQTAAARGSRHSAGGCGEGGQRSRHQKARFRHGRRASRRG